MSGLSHYKFNPLESGGVEVSKGDNTSPVSVTIEAGQTSSAIPLWLCTSLNDFYFEGLVVDPVDISAPSEETWVQLAPANPDGTVGSWQTPGNSIAIADNVGPGSGVYVKHFMRVSVPSGTTAQIKVDVKLNVTGTKRAVTS